MNRLRTVLGALVVSVLALAGIAAPFAGRALGLTPAQTQLALSTSGDMPVAGALPGAAPVLPITVLASHHPATANSCVSLYGHDPTQQTQATGFWTQNAAVHHGCGYTGREHIHCVPSLGGNYQNAYGGPVVAEQLRDTAKCPSAAPNLVKAGWQEYLPGGKQTFWYYTASKRGPPVHTTACKLAYTSSHNSDEIQFKFTQTCGLSYRAWGDWQNAGYHYGTYRKCPGCTSPFSVACAVPSTCGSGGGTLFDGGYQNKSTGVMTCTINCPRSHIHTMALVKRAGACTQGKWANSIGIQPGSLTVWWTVDSDSSTTDGCGSIGAVVKDLSGNVTHGPAVWTDGGPQSKATTKNGGSLQDAWIYMWINGGCKSWRLFPARTGWSTISCPSWLT